jgi:hypothetical protein
VGDDGFPHVTFLALSGWNRLPREDALRMATQMGAVGDLLGVRAGAPPIPVRVSIPPRTCRCAPAAGCTPRLRVPWCCCLRFCC